MYNIMSEIHASVRTSKYINSSNIYHNILYGTYINLKLVLNNLLGIRHPNKLPDLLPMFPSLRNRSRLPCTHKPNPKLLNPIIILPNRPKDSIFSCDSVELLCCNTIRATSTTSDTTWIGSCDARALKDVFTEDVGGGEEIEVPLSLLNSKQSVYI
jgi:hypothetical protein